MTKDKLGLADAGKLIASHTSDNMRDKLLAFIVKYQDEHNGATPTVDLIARSIGTVEQAVRQMLMRLETANKIHCISRNPLRVIVMQRDTILPHEQGSVTALADPNRFGRLLEAEGTRHGLCRWIGQHNAAFGRGPTLKEMMNYLGITNGAWVNRAVEIMSERGLVRYGQGINTELTEAGLMLYRMKPPTPAPVVVPIRVAQENQVTEPTQAPREPYQTTLERRADSRGARVWAELAGRFIYEWQRDHGGTAPEYKDFRKALDLRNDTTIAVALKVLERDGLIEPRAKATKRNVFLTEAGLARFGPPQPVAAPDPEPQEPPAPEAPTLPPPPTPQEWFGSVPEAPIGRDLSNVATSDLIMELIERGYTVKK